MEEVKIQYEYKILKFTSETILENEVNLHLKKQWELYGDLQITSTITSYGSVNLYYVQALKRKK